MNTLNRSEAVAFNTVDRVELIKANTNYLGNKIPVYSINAGTQDLIKVEFLFEAGMFHQIKPLQSITTNAMLEAGTSNLSADEIADKVDYYGAFLETHIAQDHASIVVYTLNKHLASIMPIVEEVLKSATLPQEEIDTYLANKKQIFLVNNQKVANVARKRLTENIFGSNHPYGINLKEIDFDSLKRSELSEFYKHFYSSDRCKIILSGKVADDTISILDKHLGGNDWASEAEDQRVLDKYAKNNSIEPVSVSNRECLIETKDPVQSAIRIGRLMFNKTHEDFIPFQIMNTILGGYFGSRLMSNIREDKGYTYGINSGLVSLKNGGYFFITTEVGVDVCQKALDEIYHEINELQTTLVKEEELVLVKNYLLGSFLRSSDGPFAMANRFKGVMIYGLDYDYYDKYIDTIKNISADTIREMANKYLNKDALLEVVVGKK